MKILVTGSKGFIAKNLISELRNRNFLDIYEFHKDSTSEDLVRYTNECDFVFHLAGVNRPTDSKEFILGNVDLTSTLLNLLKKNKKKPPILLASSIQASLNNPYGMSKKAGEDLLINFEKEFGNKALIYRFENVFGKWCKPNYNSVIATFSHNLSRNLPIVINNDQAELNLIYIDDVINELINALSGNGNYNGQFYQVQPVYSVRLGFIVQLLNEFKDSRLKKGIPNTFDGFSKKLYSTYLSYIPETDLKYELKMNSDHRGSFTEFLKTTDRGQVSINISKPGIVKGNHWHHTKNEKFLVVSGHGVIRLRKIDEETIIEYHVSGSKLEVVDIPPGYTHNIENLGKSDMVTVMWANEAFDSNRPDTIYLGV
jgi:UDP-2-acetamido-2,6-beta-L-arabino-hexul-4-ose reductase